MTNWALWGTVVNTGAVLVGSVVGLIIKLFIDLAAKRAAKNTAVLPEDENRPSRLAYLPVAVQNGLGLCAVVIGILGTFDFNTGYKLNVLVAILSVVLGAVVGEMLDLDGLLNRFGQFIEKKMKGRGGRVAESFVSSTLLFCVGAMTISGAIESGMEHQHNTYYAKSMLDLVSSVVFASTMGIGVVFSAVAVLGIQSGLTGIAVLAGGAIPADVTAEMIGVGSLLIIAIGTNLLGMTKIKIMNYLPAMFFPIALLPLYNLVF